MRHPIRCSKCHAILPYSLVVLGKSKEISIVVNVEHDCDPSNRLDLVQPSAPTRVVRESSKPKLTTSAPPGVIRGAKEYLK